MSLPLRGMWFVLFIYNLDFQYLSQQSKQLFSPLREYANLKTTKTNREKKRNKKNRINWKIKEFPNVLKSLHSIKIDWTNREYTTKKSVSLAISGKNAVHLLTKALEQKNRIMLVSLNVIIWSSIVLFSRLFSFTFAACLFVNYPASTIFKKKMWIGLKRPESHFHFRSKPINF